MLWICLVSSLIVGAVLGTFVWFGMESKKGVLAGVIVTIVFAFVFAGGMTLDSMERDSKWNGGYCPNCEVHWTPFGASDTDFGSKSKYYYCPECFKEIEL